MYCNLHCGQVNWYAVLGKRREGKCSLCSIMGVKAREFVETYLEMAFERQILLQAFPGVKAKHPHDKGGRYTDL